MCRRRSKARVELGHGGVPKPRAAPAYGSLVFPVTFFLTAAQRELVLGRVRRFGKVRAEALLLALGVSEGKKGGKR